MRVIGVQRARTVEIFNSFELLFDPVTMSLDRPFLEKKQVLSSNPFAPPTLQPQLLSRSSTCTSFFAVSIALIQDRRDGRYIGDGSVDIKGNPILKENMGNWRACRFILGNECCEHLAYYGIAYNLINYLTQQFHEGNVSDARSVSTWTGACYLTDLLRLLELS